MQNTTGATAIRLPDARHGTAHRRLRRAGLRSPASGLAKFNGNERGTVTERSARSRYGASAHGRISNRGNGARKSSTGANAVRLPIARHGTAHRLLRRAGLRRSASGLAKFNGGSGTVTERSARYGASAPAQGRTAKLGFGTHKIQRGRMRYGYRTLGTVQRIGACTGQDFKARLRASQIDTVTLGVRARKTGQ